MLCEEEGIVKTFQQFLAEMRQKHGNDYNHGKSGRVGGNPRYSGRQGLDKPDPRNSRIAGKRLVQDELKSLKTEE